MERLMPLTRMIVVELFARLKEDGLLVTASTNSGPIAGQIPSKNQTEMLNLHEAANRLNHSYFWLSRNYKKLGLRPSRIGGKLLFDKSEIERLIQRRKVGRPGRPRPVRLREL